jgi:hypothetical protein
VQSPLISFVSVSSPMYWPSNLAEPCAHAMLPSPVPSRRPSPSHLSIPFFPLGFACRIQDLPCARYHPARVCVKLVAT